VLANAVLSTAVALVWGNTTDDKKAQLANTLAPIVVTVAGMEMDVIPVLANALAPIAVSSDPAPKVADDRDAHVSNADAPTLVTAAGIAIDVRLDW
jgi:hypothetical protein